MKISEATFAGSSTRVGQRPARRLPEFAFIGRSNVGKSSLINMLCNNSKLAMTSSTPGKTKLVNHFLINDSWYLVDLPGYGYASAPQRVRNEIHDVISDYISHSEDLIMLFVLVDCRYDITRIDLDFLTELGENGVPFAIIFTKTDKIGPTVLQKQILRDREIIAASGWEELPDMLKSSSAAHRGRDEILDYIDNVLKTL